MNKVGVNDPCPCGKLREDGKPKKYKKCCQSKDQRRAELKARLKNFTRKDLISGPYKKCPNCGENTFGVSIHTGGNGYGRECTSCWYKQGFKFPPIKKKIIYLDQFFISNMAKVLDPESGGHEAALKQPFWEEAYRKIETLSKLNLVSFPDSSFHSDESLLCGDPSYEILKEVYEHLSNGCTFYDHDTITRFQVQQHLKNYMEGNPEKPLVFEAEEVVHGHLHEWIGRMRIGVNMRPYDGKLEAIHKQRKTLHESLKPVFERWQKETKRDFMEWVREEAYAFGEGTIKAHIKFLEKKATLPQKYAEEYLAGKEPKINLEDLFPPPSSEIIEDMTMEIRRAGLEGEEVFKKMGEYLRSKHIINIPIVHISSLLYAGLARKAAHGQKAYPNTGTVTDVNAISSLLPYCDAIFVDNAMAALLNEQPIKKEIEKYGTKIFCLNTKEDFLKYLDEIKNTASPEHLAIIEDSYGESWTEPYMTLIINKRQRDIDDKLDLD